MENIVGLRKNKAIFVFKESIKLFLIVIAGAVLIAFLCDRSGLRSIAGYLSTFWGVVAVYYYTQWPLMLKVRQDLALVHQLVEQKIEQEKAMIYGGDKYERNNTE